MTALTVQHVLRDLFRRIPAYAAPTAEPEERLNRPRQYAAGGSWNVQTVETYSCEEHKKCDPARVWKLPIPCVQPSEYEPYSVDFTHFIDGTQRTSRVCEIPWQAEGSSTVPVLVAQIACIALERVGRQVRLCPDISRSKTLVEMPIRFLSRNATKAISQAVAELPTHSSFEWVDTSYDTRQSDDNNGAVLRHPDLRGCYEAIPDSEFKQALVDPNWLCNQSRKWTAKHRDALEQRVFEQLAQDYGKVSTDGVHLKFFVRDGTLTSVRGKFVKSAVGLSKSFNTRFLDPHLQTRVLHLPPYHRTPVFKF